MQADNILICNNFTATDRIKSSLAVTSMQTEKEGSAKRTSASLASLLISVQTPPRKGEYQDGT